jgi:hypothetical protein
MGGERVGLGIRGVALTGVQAGRLPHQASVLTETTGRERRRLRTYRWPRARLRCRAVTSSARHPVPTGRGAVPLGLPSSARSASGLNAHSSSSLSVLRSHVSVTMLSGGMRGGGGIARRPRAGPPEGVFEGGDLSSRELTKATSRPSDPRCTGARAPVSRPRSCACATGLPAGSGARGSARRAPRRWPAGSALGVGLALVGVEEGQAAGRRRLLQPVEPGMIPPPRGEATFDTMARAPIMPA